jgi:hypothetical protein
VENAGWKKIPPASPDCILISKEPLNKSLYRHAGDRFVWNESGRTQYARRVQTRDGLQLNRHPVSNCFYWITHTIPGVRPAGQLKLFKSALGGFVRLAPE